MIPDTDLAVTIQRLRSQMANEAGARYRTGAGQPSTALADASGVGAGGERLQATAFADPHAVFAEIRSGR